jgi:predicted nucleic acid-binding protein
LLGRIVSNTSPLIWLAKIGKIDLLKKLYGEVIIPEEVYKEAVERGLQEGFSDALVIKECVEQAWIKVSKLNEREVKLCQRMMKHAFEIHLGEVQAIIQAREMDALLLMDESCGRAFAETWGLKVKGTLHVILKALREELLDKNEAKEAVLQLIKKGFRIEPRLLARILKEIEV